MIGNGVSSHGLGTHSYPSQLAMYRGVTQSWAKFNVANVTLYSPRFLS